MEAFIVDLLPFFAEMSRFSLDNNNFPYENNVLVLDMVLGSLWGVPHPINWDNVAKLVPGFTPKEVTKMLFSISILWFTQNVILMLQCASRYEELKVSGGFPHMDNLCETLKDGNSSPSNNTLLDTEDGSSSQKGTGK